MDNLTTFFNNYIKNFSNYVNRTFNSVGSTLSNLQNNQVVILNDLTKKANAQNGQIDKQITLNYNKQNKVKDINTKYEENELDRVKNQNRILLIIYYVIVIILSITLIILKPGNIYIVYGIITLCLIYPFIISYIEYIIYSIFMMLYNFFTDNPITGNVYITSNY